MPKAAWDFVGTDRQNVIEIWLNGLDPGLRGRMNAKIRALMISEGGVGPNMLTPTTDPHIKELIVNGKQALRLLLCRGPTEDSMLTDYTFLFGAKERDSRYVPRDALKRASDHRTLVIQDPTNRRVKRRVPPEQ